MDIKAVLFDLDGTLLPMDQDTFTKDYFSRLAKKLEPFGYAPENVIKSVWAGVKAMVMNDGSHTNEELFWDCFSKVLGEDILGKKPLFEEFYKTDFQKVKNSCGFNSKSAAVVKMLKEKGYRIALATNPIFPSVATESRIRWAGLEPSDFEFYTTYENSRHCKPNTAYYTDILNILGLKTEECIMVGNDVGEDMIAEKLGMKVFLLTECIINKAEADISGYPQGDLDALLEFVEK